MTATKTRPRAKCPNGTRRNRITGLCSPVAKMKKMKQPSPILSLLTPKMMKTSLPRWIEATTGLIIYTNIIDLPSLLLQKKTIAAFDMDGTLITTRSGRKFPKDAHDWQWIVPAVPTRLAELAISDALLIIMSNQSGWAKHAADLRKKVEVMMSAVVMASTTNDTPFICMFATDHNKYRKPMTGMADYIRDAAVRQRQLNGFYVGDAMTAQDHSQSDYYFALNAGLQFHYAPNYWGILAHPIPLPTPLLPSGLTIPAAKCDTVAKMAEKVVGAGFDAIILVGPPAVGKSTLAAYLHEQYQFEIMNNDTMPTKAQYNKRLKTLIDKGVKMVIDNTNPAESVRKALADQLHNYRVAFIDFKVDRVTAEYLNHYRCERTGKWIPDIVYNIYYKKYEAPEHDNYKVFQYVPCYEMVDKTRFY